jgi:SAM-dependent methyltransferase
MTARRRGIRRTMAFFQAFRVEQDDPARLYTLMANDVIDTLSDHAPIAGRRVLDVGGGPGYVAEAFDRAGGSCVTVDPSLSELHLHGRSSPLAIVADGQQLPFADGRFDIVHCSNVLEHVPEPRRLLTELGRCSAPSGLVYLSFTNWLSPWGGHEISPWHYLGAERAVTRYEARGGTVKNRPGESLFKLNIGDVICWLRQVEAFEILSIVPRYYPSWTRPITRVPGVREVLTWNLEAVMRRRA